VRLLLLGFLLGPSVGLLSAQATPGRAGEPGAGLPAYQNVERVKWAALDTVRTSQALRTTRAVALEQLAALTGGTVAFESSLVGLDDSVGVPASLSIRRAIARVLDGSVLSALVDPGTATFVIRRAGGAIRRVRTIDARGGAPLAGVEVVVPRFARSARTDAAGQAVLGDVGSGDVPIQLRAVGYLAATDTLREGRETVVALRRLSPTLTEVVVTPGSSRALESPLGVAQSVTREDVAARPQIGEDLFRAVNRLPGVSSNDFSAGLNVRGARSDELLVMLDGMPLREPYHLKDIGAGLSILDVHATGGVDVVPGSFTSEYGERLTGVMSISSREPAPGERLLSSGLSASWLRGLAGARTRDGKFSWLASARRGYLDLIFAITNADATFTVGYSDAFMRGSWHPTARDAVTISVLGSTDRTTQEVQFDAPPFRSQYGSRYGWMHWSHAGTRLAGQTVVGQSFNSRLRTADGGTGPVSIGCLADDRDLGVSSVRSSWSWLVAPTLAVRFGTDLQRQAARYRYDRVRPTRATLFGFENRADTVGVAIDTVGRWAGAWLAPRLQLGPVVTEVGVRVDRWDWRGPTAWQPRLNLSWAIDGLTSVRAALGDYAQPQALDALPVDQGVRQWAPPERARHLALGIDRVLPGRINARLDLYQRRLTSVAPRFAELLPDIDVARDLRFSTLRVDPDRGRARGIEFSLASSSGARVEWSGWYALSQIVDRIDGRWVPRDLDQRHSGAFDLSMRTTDRRWRVSGAVVLRQGWPLTPVDVRVDTFMVAGRPRPLASPTYGAYNSARLPVYARVDLRLLRRYQTGHGQWTVFADIFNLLGRRNPLGVAATVQSLEPLRWEREVVGFVPRIPTVGVSWER